MKINSLRFANLNSLKGEFLIDFSVPPLNSAGIFVITGPTGAGKTTILDAIAIALYGQTPRLSSGDSGEILSRHSGECYAEVEFTVDSGTYRSRWSRNRAHGKSHGKLQAPKMMLVKLNGTEDEILEEQVRPVIARVEKLTGLDFRRFSRSVMLAQGNFASFLKADVNERAELLEKMTGTEIYKYISIGAFERSRQEKQTLEQLVHKHESLEMMSDSDLQELTAKKGSIASEAEKIQQQVGALLEQKKVRENYDALSLAIETVQKELVELDRVYEEQKESFDRLARAEAAMPMEASYRSLEENLVRQKLLTDERQTLSTRLAEVKKSADLADQELGKLNTEKKLLLDKWAAREKEIATADKLDQRISLEEDKVKACNKIDADLAEKFNALDTKKSKAQSVLSDRQKEIAAAENYLAENSIDAGLGEVLVGLSQKISTLKQLRDHLAENQNQRVEFKNEIERLLKEQNACSLQHTEALSSRDAAKKSMHSLEVALSEKLAGQSLDEVEFNLKSATERKQNLSDLTRFQDEHDRITAESNKLNLQLITLKSDLEQKQKEILEVDKEIESQANVLKQLQAKRNLEIQIKKYEDDRKGLAENEPCPLCGALEHPWADSAPVDDSLEKALVDQEKAVISLTGKSGVLSGQIKLLSVSIKQVEQDFEGADRKRKGALQRCEEFFKSLKLTSKSKDAFSSELKAVTNEIESLSEKISVVRDLEKQLAVKTNELTQADHLLAKLTNSLEQLILARQKTENAMAKVNEDSKHGSDTLVGLEQELSRELKRFTLELPAANTEKQFAVTLQGRWHSYDKARTTYTDQKQMLTELEKDISLILQDVKRLTDQQQKNKQELAGIVKNCTALTCERKSLLDHLSVEDARKSLEAERDEFSKRHTLLIGKIAGLEAEQRSISEQLAASVKNLESNKAQIDETQKKLSAQLVDSQFSSIEEVAQALLEQSEFAALKKQRQFLLDKRLAAQSRLGEHEKGLNQIADKAAKISLAEVAENLKLEQEKLSITLQELGEIKAIEKRQETLRLSHKKQALEIAAQQKEYKRWQVLNDLLGSSDGKKYRRFAQGLTLDHLIYLANRQLIKLNDRYLLQRGADELEIEVVDTYQADTVRSTDTLSGGEEFLVSLALALGLAGLAGSSVSVDSLFLDEGFGTLDTETLETAIASLALLHESGKTIGVISHVDALKERIPVQIQVQKGAGGVSSLSVVAN